MSRKSSLGHAVMVYAAPMPAVDREIIKNYEPPEISDFIPPSMEVTQMDVMLRKFREAVEEIETWKSLLREIMRSTNKGARLEAYKRARKLLEKADE